MFSPRKRPYNHVVLAVILCAITYLLFWHLPSSFSYRLSATISPPSSVTRYAYATFLSPHTPSSASSDSISSIFDSQDPYFTSLQLLTYQLLHSPRTRTQQSPPIPLLILTLPSVPKSQITLLASYGATIVPIQRLDLPATFNASSASISRSRFRDVLAKLRLWQLTSYDKILALDADTILLSPLDSIFTDPQLSAPIPTLPENKNIAQSASIYGPPLPSTYLLSASTDTWGSQVDWIGSGHPSYLCACFMLLAPSATLFKYYESVLNRPEAAFTAAFPDQDLLIYAHRAEGRMPWRKVPQIWSANDGAMMEKIPGLKSLHVKAWKGAEGGNLGGEAVEKLWKGLVEEMEAFYLERAALGGKRSMIS